ncbi:transglycosylase domain-containing protein [Flavobacterium sp. UBA6046]|jgi:membrane peptidoglycan carboxypeptidase|uniref:transglycosylase domain-containing protein n=1 Tax=Flavobacterium sp. UBA6046 TaxID=1946552 RepID=UPI0025C43472|nr:transglycosylase domain-containing protein [Flavobacterium sp. UBA6046]
MKIIENAFDSYNGYVLYCQTEKSSAPIGIISHDFRRKAIVSEIPSFLKYCIIQIEDKRFYQHNGIDYRSIVRAFIENIKANKVGNYTL